MPLNDSALSSWFSIDSPSHNHEICWGTCEDLFSSPLDFVGFLNEIFDVGC